MRPPGSSPMGSFIRGKHRGSSRRGPGCCSLGEQKPGVMGKPDFGTMFAICCFSKSQYPPTYDMYLLAKTVVVKDI